MAAALKRLKTLGAMLLPQGFYELQRRLQGRAQLSAEMVAVIAANAAVKGRHHGERCFILGNGPSVKGLDLAALAGETVISVSSGYLHADHDLLAPRYHCLPQVTYGLMTEDDVVQWFVEMHDSIGDAELFLSTTEYELVQRRGLFRGRTVRYVHFHDSFDSVPHDTIVDVAKPVPRVESVPIMCLMLAMYMGFKEIVLLGVDHDHFLTSRYTYAFEPVAQKDKDITVGKDGASLVSRHDDFQSLARLWRQYRALALIGRSQGLRVVNSTPGGELDEFERVPFSTWCKP